MQPTHDRTDRNVHDLGDLLVRETLDISEQNRDPELLGQVLERLLHRLVGNRVEDLGLGPLLGLDRLEPADALVQVEVLDVVELDLLRAGASWPGTS